jgi:hypothetical protein
MASRSISLLRIPSCAPAELGVGALERPLVELLAPRWAWAFLNPKPRDTKVGLQKGEILFSVHCDPAEEIKRAKEVLKSAGGEDVSPTGESSVEIKKTDRDLAGTTAGSNSIAEEGELCSPVPPLHCSCSLLLFIGLRKLGSRN